MKQKRYFENLKNTTCQFVFFFTGYPSNSIRPKIHHALCVMRSAQSWKMKVNLKQCTSFWGDMQYAILMHRIMGVAWRVLSFRCTACRALTHNAWHTHGLTGLSSLWFLMNLWALMALWMVRFQHCLLQDKQFQLSRVDPPFNVVKVS